MCLMKLTSLGFFLIGSEPEECIKLSCKGHTLNFSERPTFEQSVTSQWSAKSAEQNQYNRLQRQYMFVRVEVTRSDAA